MEYIILGAALISGLFLLGAYRRGLTDGMRIQKGKDIETRYKPEKRKDETPVFDEKTEAILRNIGRYDGTGAGQKTID